MDKSWNKFIILSFLDFEFKKDFLNNLNLNELEINKFILELYSKKYKIALELIEWIK